MEELFKVRENRREQVRSSILTTEKKEEPLEGRAGDREG